MLALNLEAIVKFIENKFSISVLPADHKEIEKFVLAASRAAREGAAA